MFDSKKARRRGDVKFTSVIDEDTTFNGDVYFAKSILINGVVTGNVTASSDNDISLICIGQSGSVTGNITATRIIIDGRLEGTIDAEGTVEMGISSRVRGDCSYRELAMAPGAYFEGSFNPKTAHENHKLLGSATKKEVNAFTNKKTKAK